MKTPNEIAWNLLESGGEAARFNILPLAEKQRISEITGTDMDTLNLLWKKLCISSFLSRIKSGTEIAKQVIDEMETGKPHYEIDSEGIEQNDKSTD